MLTLSLDTAFQTLAPLFLFVIAMVIYSVFIFKFYRFIATRDIFEFNLQQYHSRAQWAWLKKTLYLFLYFLEYVILFPIFVSIWFVTFAVLLMFLSRTPNTNLILLIAMAIVSSVRITAYYDEDLSKDLAKMLPFGLLAVLLVDISFISYTTLQTALLDSLTFVDTILYYLLFAIIIEFVLRIFTFIFVSDEIQEEQSLYTK